MRRSPCTSSRPHTMLSDSGPARALVIGGSIGGLCAGVALHGEGIDVEVHERIEGPMKTRGAGIVVQPELMQLLRNYSAPDLPMTGCTFRRYLNPQGGDGQVQHAPQPFTSWEAIYKTLRAALPPERYHMGSPVLLAARDGPASSPSASLLSGDTVEADIIVCADGANSRSRRLLLPDVSSQYAGYVAWRGVLDERDTPSDLVRFFDDHFTFSEARSGGHILVYLIPGDGATTEPGARRLNWVWYVVADAAERTRLLLDKDERQHRASISPGEAAPAIVQQLVERARREVHPMLARLVEATPEPFLQTIADVVPPGLVFGRACLVGDAAFVVRPHTAGAAAKAAKDATVLATALRRAKSNIDAGLRSFEEMQLEYGQSMTNYGIALGRRWAA